MGHTIASQFVSHDVPGRPQVLLLAIDLHEDLIDVERIAITTVSPFETTSVSSSELNAPESDGFVADTNASFREQVFDITTA